MIGLGEVRRKEESFTTLQSGHLLYHSEANNGQAGVGFLVNKKWKDIITRVSSGNSRVAELVLRITDRYQLKIVQVYAPTTSHSDEETDNFYNTIDNILEKQTHYTIVMGDFNAKVGGQTNTPERVTGCFGLGQRNERGDTLVEWATAKNFKIMNTQFQKKAGRRWTWRIPDGHTRNENKQRNSREKNISSPTRALMKKRREIIETNTPRDHIECVEICKTMKRKRGKTSESTT